MAEVVVEVPARHDYLALVRIVVAACAELHEGLADGRVDDLCLAVSEACSNAVDAHDAAATVEPMVVRCELADDHLTVTVTDQGTGFDAGADRDLPDPADPRRLGHERGLGLSLMRILSDQVRITSGAGGTTVTLTFDSPTTG